MRRGRKARDFVRDDIRFKNKLEDHIKRNVKKRSPKKQKQAPATNSKQSAKAPGSKSRASRYEFKGTVRRRFAGRRRYAAWRGCSNGNDWLRRNGYGSTR